ncbi:Hypp6297 [Branchiostoma lanceolatum]|uniref:Hypp6297 protein n=1 Tax=Branchiostoma lanceolatum TaxID=7740 RepID=A0A8J9VU90_BRALA|nr:Hypp6297 [Branchiostoma lanceolatum]
MSSEKLVVEKGFGPSLAGLGLTRPYKRQGGRRTGLVLLAGGCLGGVLVCAVLMPLVCVTMSELQQEVTELRNLVITRSAPTASPGTEDRRNDTAAGGAHRERRQADLTPSIVNVYVRWGREDCGENAKTVYSGVVGSGSYNHHGGGSDYLCLPLEGVEWNNPVAGHQHGSYMYGAEYQLNSAGYFSAENMESGSITNPMDYDVPCSVCHVGRSARVMIPARLSCPGPEWSKEYSGYLMSSHHAHQSNKNFVCVDGAPNLRPGSSANDDGALMYLVEAACGSLPCGPYISGYELTCVVCTI